MVTPHLIAVLLSAVLLRITEGGSSDQATAIPCFAPLRTPRNGNLITKPPFALVSSVAFSCNEGFLPKPANGKVTCDDGEWSSQPACPQNGKHQCSAFQLHDSDYNSIATNTMKVNCPNGDEPGNVAVTIHEDDGKPDAFYGIMPMVKTGNFTYRAPWKTQLIRDKSANKPSEYYVNIFAVCKDNNHWWSCPCHTHRCMRRDAGTAVDRKNNIQGLALPYYVRLTDAQCEWDCNLKGSWDQHWSKDVKFGV